MDSLGKEAERLYNTVKKYARPNPTPQNIKLEQMARKLYDDFRCIVNPRELERQATEIKEFLFHGMKPGCMQTTHCSELKAGYEALRLQLRNYQ